MTSVREPARTRRVAAWGAALLLIALVLAAFVAAAPIKFRRWGSFDLAQLGQQAVRGRLPGKALLFLTDPSGRTTVHDAGRPDLRVACGWLLAERSDWKGPRFFYVLFQRRLAWVSTETVFVQSRAGELSPGWGETWCRSAPLASAFASSTSHRA